MCNFVYCDWLQAEGTDPVDQSVYLTAFTLIALHKATKIRDPILQLQVRPHLLVSSLNTSANLSTKHNTEEAAHKPSCFQIHEDSISSAVAYISQHALSVKSVYVRAVATYALTLHDPNSMISFQLISSLEKLARQKGVCVVFLFPSFCLALCLLNGSFLSYCLIVS